VRLSGSILVQESSGVGPKGAEKQRNVRDQLGPEKTGLWPVAGTSDGGKRMNEAGIKQNGKR
jgi:hypothetical protein